MLMHADNGSVDRLLGRVRGASQRGPEFFRLMLGDWSAQM